MSNVEELVDSRMAKQVLEEWIRTSEDSMSSLCGIGIRNCMSGIPLVSPQIFLKNGGKAIHSPPNEITWTMAATILCGTSSSSSQIEESNFLTSGMITYEIGNSKMILIVAWKMNKNGQQQEEITYNVSCKPRAACDERLYDEIMKDSSSSENIIQKEEEEGFMILSRIVQKQQKQVGDDDYDGDDEDKKERFILMIEIANNERPFGQALLTRPGRPLEESCKQMLNSVSSKVACSIGVANLTRRNFINCQTMLDSGRCFIDPSNEIHPLTSTPSLFCKKQQALRGVGGCVSFDIEHSSINNIPLMIVITFIVPFSEKFGSNQFNVHCIPHCSELSWSLYRYELETSCLAIGGELIRQEYGLDIIAKMSDGSKSILLIEFRDLVPLWPTTK